MVTEMKAENTGLARICQQILCEWITVYCTTPALDGCPLHLDRIPCTQMMTSLNICGTAFYDLQHPWFHPSQPTHGPHHQFISISSTIIHTSHGLGLVHSTYHCGEKMWNVVEGQTIEGQTMERWEETRQGATQRQYKCHLWKAVSKKMIQFCLMYPLFWFSTLEYKRVKVGATRNWSPYVSKIVLNNKLNNIHNMTPFCNSATNKEDVVLQLYCFSFQKFGLKT